MFGKKPRRHHALEIRSADGRLLFSGQLQRLTLPEPVLLALSEEFFADPEPCEIHRSAVMSRAMAEIEAALPVDAPCRVDCLNARMQTLLSGYAQADTVRLYEEVRG